VDRQSRAILVGDLTALEPQYLGSTRQAPAANRVDVLAALDWDHWKRREFEIQSRILAIRTRAVCGIEDLRPENQFALFPSRDISVISDGREEVLNDRLRRHCMVPRKGLVWDESRSTDDQCCCHLQSKLTQFSV